MSINKLPSKMLGIIWQPIEWTKEDIQRAQMAAFASFDHTLRKGSGQVTEDAEFVIIEPLKLPTNE
jgi:hypothetical protein